LRNHIWRTIRDQVGRDCHFNRSTVKRVRQLGDQIGEPGFIETVRLMLALADGVISGDFDDQTGKEIREVVIELAADENCEKSLKIAEGSP
jgi:hypothetical protein